MTIRVRMLDPRFKLQTDALYDRAPAELSLDALVEFFDASGAPLGERPLQATRKERLQLELTQQRCDYIVDPLLQDTSTMLATQFMQEARMLLAPTAPPAAAGTTVTPAELTSKATAVPAAPTSAPVQLLSFKATLLDENGNLIIESGERIRVRVQRGQYGNADGAGQHREADGPADGPYAVPRHGLGDRHHPGGRIQIAGIYCDHATIPGASAGGATGCAAQRVGATSRSAANTADLLSTYGRSA
ncbi:MAG: hypothetical protein QM771_09670 [Nitrospira sp.]